MRKLTGFFTRKDIHLVKRKNGCKVLFLAACVVGGLLTGCGKDGNQNVNEPNNAAQIGSEKEDRELTDQQSGDDTITDAQAGQNQDSEIYGLLSYQYPSLTFVNESGEVVSKNDFPDVNKSIACSEGNTVFLCSYDYDEETYESTSEISAYHVDTGEEKVLFRGKSYQYCGVYNDVLYIVTGGYDEPYEEYRIDLATGETLEYDNSFFEGMSGYMLWNGYNSGEVIAEQLDLYGFTVVSKENEYFQYDGINLTKLNLLENVNYVRDFDQNAVIMTVADEKTYKENQLYVFQISNQSSIPVTDNMEVYLGYDNGYLYYSEMNQEIYGREEYLIYEYHVEDKQKKLVAKVQKHPGMEDYLPGVTGFQLKGDYAYFIADDGVTTGWYRAGVREKLDGNAVDIGASLKEYDLLKYGTVECLSHTEYCPNCNLPVLQYYEEYFQVAESVSKEADKINQFLYNEATKNYDAQVEESGNREYYPEECEYHGTYMGLETSDYEVVKIGFIGSDYMTIDMSGYWYGGGAHGMPMQNQYLMNIITGESVTIKDLFPGTEDELKTIVAQKTKEDFLTYDEGGSPYFAADADGVYADAYEYIGFDSFYASFGEEELIIEYPPYLMGSYAAGYIEVPISYAELGIKEALSIK